MKKAPTVTARRNGVCCTCHQDIAAGETIALNVTLRQWGHHACIDPERAAGAAPLPILKPRSHTSRGQVSRPRRTLPVGMDEDGFARMLPLLYLRGEAAHLDEQLPVACPQCGDMNVHLDIVGFITDDDREPRDAITVTFPFLEVRGSPEAAAIQQNGPPHRGPMMFIQYWCEARCRGRIDFRVHKGVVFGSLHNLPRIPETDDDDLGGGMALSYRGGSEPEVTVNCANGHHQGRGKEVFRGQTPAASAS